MRRPAFLLRAATATGRIFTTPARILSHHVTGSEPNDREATPRQRAIPGKRARFKPRRRIFIVTPGFIAVRSTLRTEHKPPRAVLCNSSATRRHPVPAIVTDAPVFISHTFSFLFVCLTENFHSIFFRLICSASNPMRISRQTADNAQTASQQDSSPKISPHKISISFNCRNGQAPEVMNNPLTN